MLFETLQLKKILSLKFDIGHDRCFAAPFGYLLFMLFGEQGASTMIFLSILALAFLYGLDNNHRQLGSSGPYIPFFIAWDRVATVIICTFTLLFAADLML